MEDRRPKLVTRKARALGESERLVKQSERRLDAREPIAADADPEEDVGPFHVGEARTLRE